MAMADGGTTSDKNSPEARPLSPGHDSTGNASPDNAIGFDARSADGGRGSGKQSSGGGKRCECGLRVPTLGPKGSGRGGALWCKNCPKKPADAVNVTSRKCECGRCEPSLGIPAEGRRHPRWCARCPGKPAHAVNVVNKRCECGRCMPSLGIAGQGKKSAKWCAKCPGKPPNAVNVVSIRCECGRGQPSLGLPGEARKDARWCRKCPTKPGDAVNVVSKKCECGRGQPSLGMPGEPRKKARWCSKCPGKPPQAVNSYSYYNQQHMKTEMTAAPVHDDATEEPKAREIATNERPEGEGSLNLQPGMEEQDEERPAVRARKQPRRSVRPPASRTSDEDDADVSNSPAAMSSRDYQWNEKSPATASSPHRPVPVNALGDPRWKRRAGELETSVIPSAQRPRDGSPPPGQQGGSGSRIADIPDKRLEADGYSQYYNGAALPADRLAPYSFMPDLYKRPREGQRPGTAALYHGMYNPSSHSEINRTVPAFSGLLSEGQCEHSRSSGDLPRHSPFPPNAAGMVVPFSGLLSDEYEHSRMMMPGMAARHPWPVMPSSFREYYMMPEELATTAIAAASPGYYGVHPTASRDPGFRSNVPAAGRLTTSATGGSEAGYRDELLRRYGDPTVPMGSPYIGAEEDLPSDSGAKQEEQ